MSTIDRLRTIIEPLVDDLGLELFDLEFAGSTVSVTIDVLPGAAEAPERAALDHPESVDLSDITSVTRAVSRALDEHDPIDGAFTLEVSSPGLERSLRTPRHFDRAIGQTLAVKTVPNVAAGRRLKGTLTAADADGIDLTLADPPGEVVRLPYTDIEKARTVFEWGPEPRPTKPPRTPPAKGAKGEKNAPAAKGAKRAQTSKTSKTSKAPSAAADANHETATSTKSKPPQQKKVTAS